MAEKVALALDGPHNGQYITAAQAVEHGYELCDWVGHFDNGVSMSEKVYMMPQNRDEPEDLG